MKRKNIKKRKNQQYTYYSVYNVWRKRLFDMAVSCITWEGIMENYTYPVIENILIRTGQCAVFYEEELSMLIAMECVGTGSINAVGLPSRYQAVSANGEYARDDLIEGKNAVIIRNTPTGNPSFHQIEYYTERLTELSLSWSSNIKGVRHPIGLSCPEEYRLTMENIINNVELGAPYLFLGDGFEPEMIKSINTGAPYLADKLSEQLSTVWGEWLTYLGVPSMNIQKRERLLKDEVAQMMGGSIACRSPRMQQRRKAVKQIKEIFGVDVDCFYTIDKEPIPDLMPDSQNNIQKTEGGSGWQNTPNN